MTTPKNQTPRIGKIRKLLVTKTAIVVATLDAVLLIAFFSVKPVLHAKSVGDALYFLMINVVIWSLAAVFFKNSMEKQLRKRDEELGVELSPQDKIDLYVWTKYGYKPKSKHLQPVLGKFLDYVERNNKKSKAMPFFIGALFLLGLLVCGNVLALTNSSKHPADNIADLIYWSLMFVGILAASVRASQLPKRYKQMRHQLTKSAK